MGYNPANNDGVTVQETTSDEEAEKIYLLNKAVRHGTYVWHDQRCPLCERTNIIYDLPSKDLGCAYAMSGGLCTNHEELSEEEHQELLGSGFEWPVAHRLLTKDRG